MDSRYSQTGLMSNAATCASEWRGFLALVGVLLITVVAPIALAIVEGNPNVNTFAVVFVWIFNTWLFGYTRMLMSGILLVSSSWSGGPADETLLRERLTQLALSEGMNGKTNIHLQADRERPTTLEVHMSDSTSSRLVIPSDDPRLASLYDPYLGTTSRWALLTTIVYSITVDLETTSAHQRIAARANLVAPAPKPTHSWVYSLGRHLPLGRLNPLKPETA